VTAHHVSNPSQTYHTDFIDRERYEIPEARNVIRGTLRYACFPSFVKCLVDMGYLSDAAHPLLDSTDAKTTTWSALTASLLGVGATTASESALISAIDTKTTFSDPQARETIQAGLRWIGLFSDAKLGKNARATPLDTLCAALEERCQFAPGERDLVFLQHKFAIINKDGSKEIRTSTLVENGDPNGYSAMAKTVGVPCGVATCMVLDGRISKKGILAPMEWDIVEPLMEELKKTYDIELTEKTL
jgi:saccharopine dehydrogenase (NADP+, L-glutamate forming)